MPEVFEEGPQNGIESPSVDMTKKMSTSPANLYSPYMAQSHHHNESTSTSASESAESSPTTTLSLADDSSVTEMSPGSSPESPMAKPPMRRPHTADETTKTPPQPSSFFELNARSFTPGKRARNLKNLAVNTTGSVGVSRGATTSLPVAAPKIDTADTLAPLRTANSAFKRPPSPPKRRPSNLSLTIVTPANNASGQGTSSISSVVPPTPSLTRPNMLRHFQSSPSLPLASRYQSLGSSPMICPSPIRPTLERSSSDLVTRSDDDFNFDLPQSREEKPEAYPEGPICVFDPYIDLYLEPTAEQASKYDVILNVASEVRNPFLKYSTPDPTKEGIRVDGGGGIQYAPKRARTSSSSSNASGSKVSAESTTPTTPKATPDKNTFALDLTSGDKKPEYIHIPWEHNTDIVSDLHRLVKLIDDRVRRGKKVLIHCQCGVSRSATLVVAYCMYIHPEYSVQQAYDTVKKRSKWIGPNMNLIMQLQEFSSLLSGASRMPIRHAGLRSLTPIEASAAWSEWRRNTVSAAPRDTQGPKTAPLLAPNRNTYDGSNISNSPAAVSPGPSSAPSGISWPMRDDTSASAPVDRNDGRALSVPGVAALVNNPTEHTVTRRRSSEKKRPQSLRFETTSVSTIPETVVSSISEATVSATPVDAVPEASPRSEEFAMSALRPSAATSPDDHFGLMSPTTSTFTHSPLDRAALLGALGMGSTIHADNSRRRTPNFSVPFRKYPNAPPVVQVATGVFPGVQKPPLIRQALLSRPSLNVDSLLDPLLSPRASSFTLNPFSTTAPVQRSPSATKIGNDDPRSPAQQGINPIVRNIADAL